MKRKLFVETVVSLSLGIGMILLGILTLEERGKSVPLMAGGFAGLICFAYCLYVINRLKKKPQNYKQKEIELQDERNVRIKLKARSRTLSAVEILNLISVIVFVIFQVGIIPLIMNLICQLIAFGFYFYSLHRIEEEDFDL